METEDRRKDSREGDDGRLRVLIVDDDPLARRVVRDALQDAGFVVPAEASDGREAVELALHYRPDIVLMDVVMGAIDGIAATRKILATAPEIHIVMLSISDDDELGVLALRAGASGYLTKDMDLSSLARTLHGVADGEAAISRAFTAKLIDRLRRLPEAGVGLRPVKSELTSREWEVLDLLCEGASTDGIGEELVLSPETVRSHIRNILRKLGVRSRGEAIERARGLRQPGAAA